MTQSGQIWSIKGSQWGQIPQMLELFCFFVSVILKNIIKGIFDPLTHLSNLEYTNWWSKDQKKVKKCPKSYALVGLIPLKLTFLLEKVHTTPTG